MTDAPDEDGVAGSAAATASGHVEAERTFTVADGWAVPRLEGVGAVARVEPARRFTHTATYWDTLELHLLRSKRTLRRRVGGHDAGWHLKTPRADGSRLELSQPLGSFAVRVPPALLAELADIASLQALVPVAVLRTRRAERALLDSDGRQLALMADDTVDATVSLGGKRHYHWRELEVELVEGEPALLDALTDALLASGLQVSPTQSKLGRALADVRAELEGTRAPTAGELVRRYLAAQVGVLQWCEADVRAEQPDAVHKARVATRRLRSALRTFRPLLDRDVTDPLRAEIAWVTDLLGAPRDAQVLRSRFQAAAIDLQPQHGAVESLERLQEHLQVEHDRAHAELLAGLDSRRYEKLLSALTDLLIGPPWQPVAHEPAQQVLPKLVAKAAKAVGRAVVEAQEAQEPEQRDEALHDVRKLIKAARYAVEAAAEVLRKANQRIHVWTELQDALGEYQDSIVARQAIADVSDRARQSGEDTFALGVLSEREAAGARTVLGESETVLDAIRATAKQPLKVRH